MRYSVAYFEATRPLEALGASGKRYRFEGPGDVVAVDLHDRRSMLAVQGLRQVVDL